MVQKGAEGPNKQGQVTQEVSNMALKTENFEDPLEGLHFQILEISGLLTESVCPDLRQIHANVYVLAGDTEILS